MRRRTIPGLLGLMMLLTAAQARAADAALETIPQTASVVLRLKAPSETIKKTTDFANKIDPNAGAQVQGFSPFLGVLISNPPMTGVDQTKNWYVAVFARAEEPPALVFVIPATDAGAMRQALGPQFKSFTRGEYVVYGDDSEMIDQIQSGGTRQQPITKSISEASQKIIDGSDLSVFVNVPRLREIYKEQLAEASAQLEQALEQMKAMAPQQPGVDLSQAFEMYGKVGREALQAIQDTSGVAIALSIQPQAISFVDYVDIASGTPTAELLRDWKPGPLSLLAKLPAERHAYIASAGNLLASMGKWSMQAAMAMYAGNESAKQQFQELMDQYEKLEFGNYAAAFELGDSGQGAMRAFNVMEVDSVEDVRELGRKAAAMFGDIEGTGGIDPKYELKPDAEKVGSHSVDVVKMTLELSPDADENTAAGLEMSKSMMEFFYGPEGMTQRFAYLKSSGLVLQTMGGGRQTMEQLVEAVEKRNSDSVLTGPAASTRKALSGEASLLALMDIPRTASQAAQLVAQSGMVPIPLDAESIDSVKLQPSYAGLSVATGDNSVRVDTYVPLEQIQGVVKLVQMFLQQAAQQQQQF